MCELCSAVSQNARRVFDRRVSHQPAKEEEEEGDTSLPRRRRRKRRRRRRRWRKRRRRRSGWPDRLSNKLHFTKVLLLLLNTLKNTNTQSKLYV